MAESVDALFARWRQNGDVQTTIALCEAVTDAPRADIGRSVGPIVKAKFGAHAGALVAAGRMQLALGDLEDAQDMFVRAGKVAPKDGDIYRFLGETLLRKGDAERAAKVLERAVSFGAKSGDADLWLERARGLFSIQKSNGASAVAAEVARAGLAKPVTRPMRAQLLSASDDETLIRDEKPKIETPGLNAAVYSREVPTRAAGIPVTPAPVAAVPAWLEPPSDPLPANPFLPNPPPAPPPVPSHMQQGGGDLKPWQPPPPIAPAGMMAGLAPMGASAASPYRGDIARLPDPRDVLDALALAGIYEKDDAARVPLHWDKPAGGPRRRLSYAALITGIVVSVGSVAGVYYWVRDRRAKDHVKAEAVLARVDDDLRAADPKKFGDTETAIGQAFDLESRSPHAALAWTRERAIKGLVLGPNDIAFEDAVARAKEVGVQDSDLAFASAASFLFQGDTAGAAGVLGKSDQLAGRDPYYELIAGAVLERAGDPRALERYAAALQLDPQLYTAAVSLARVTAIEGDPKRALPLAQDLRGKFPDRAEPIALVALAWAKDPQRDKPPHEVELAVDLKDLPVSLRMVPKAVSAFVKAQARQEEDARAALKAALVQCDSPGQATWIGSVALDVGDQDLARKAALVAVSYSAVYPPARMLAARVALSAGRYDEALKAAEDLDAQAIDVAIVRSAASYEKLDIDGVAKANEGLAKEARGLPVVSGVLVMPDALFLHSPPPAAKVVEAAQSGAPWADIVAMDETLLLGDLDTADKIAAIWKDAPQEAARTLRLATLARFKGNLDDADKLSQASLAAAPTMRAITERAMVLVALKKKDDAEKILKAYPTALGPLGKWLSAYVLASLGKPDDARARTATDDPPPPEAPAFARALAASALGAMKDTRRGQPYLRKIVTDGFASPDIAAAAEAMHMPKVTPLKR
jgi:tetratricopeptide (TPR) repeat protein